MITSEMVYWITRLDHFKGFGFFLIIVSVFLAFIIRGVIADNEFRPSRLLWFLVPIFISFCGFIMTVFVPNTKEMCAILIIPKMANSETIKELGTDALEIKNLAISYLKEKMEVEKK